MANKISSLVLVFILAVTTSVFAKTKKAAPVRGKIIAPVAAIYIEPDFDAEIIAEVKEGEVFDVSRRVFGPFHRIRLKDGSIGYISDIDISVPGKKMPAPEKSEPNTEVDKNDTDPWLDSTLDEPDKINIDDKRWRGASLHWLQYREDTMGLRPTENMIFYGIKVSGPETAIDGPVPIDTNFLISTRAPKFYEQATGYSAGGFILIANSLLQMTRTHSPRTMTFWGMGPMVKYSKYDVALNANGVKTAYSLEDLVLGLAFNLGISQQIGSVALRVEAEHFWEKIHYSGVSFSVQFEF